MYVNTDMQSVHFGVFSSKNGGTMYSSAIMEPDTTNPTTKYFVDFIIKSQVLCATMKILNITEMDEYHHLNQIYASSSIKSDTLDNIVHKVVKRFIELFSGSTNLAENTDKVNEYARETLSLLLLHGGFLDAVREGDDERVLRVWKFLILRHQIRLTTALKPSTCWHNTTYYYPLD